VVSVLRQGQQKAVAFIFKNRSVIHVVVSFSVEGGAWDARAGRGTDASSKAAAAFGVVHNVATRHHAEHPVTDRVGAVVALLAEVDWRVKAPALLRALYRVPVVAYYLVHCLRPFLLPTSCVLHV
jgi:hypothetical protein